MGTFYCDFKLNFMFLGFYMLLLRLSFTIDPL